MSHSGCTACNIAREKGLDQWGKNFLHDLAAFGVPDALLHRAASLAVAS